MAIAEPIVRPTPMPEPRLYTAEELESFPSDWHYELINGKLRRLPLPASRNHGSHTGKLAAYLGYYILQNDLGEIGATETGFLLSRNPDTVKAPDFAFTVKARVPPPQKRGYAPFVPDLVLETRSPNDRKIEIADKIAEWLHFGVRIVLDLDPEAQQLTVHRPDAAPRTLGAGDTLELGDLLPGFELPLRGIFEGDD